MAERLSPWRWKGSCPQRLRDLGVAEIERLTILHGNRAMLLAELFRVSGNADDEQVTMIGDLSGVHWIVKQLGSHAH